MGRDASGAAIVTIKQLWCASWGGHTTTRHFAADRIYDKCVSCGWESPGWPLDAPKPVPVFLRPDFSKQATKGFTRRVVTFQKRIG